MHSCDPVFLSFFSLPCRPGPRHTCPFSAETWTTTSRKCTLDGKRCTFVRSSKRFDTGEEKKGSPFAGRAGDSSFHAFWVHGDSQSTVSLAVIRSDSTEEPARSGRSDSAVKRNRSTIKGAPDATENLRFRRVIARDRWQETDGDENQRWKKNEEGKEA